MIVVIKWTLMHLWSLISLIRWFSGRGGCNEQSFCFVHVSSDWMMEIALFDIQVGCILSPYIPATQHAIFRVISLPNHRFRISHLMYVFFLDVIIHHSKFACSSLCILCLCTGSHLLVHVSERWIAASSRVHFKLSLQKHVSVNVAFWFRMN
jgi:hypothetical protein